MPTGSEPILAPAGTTVRVLLDDLRDAFDDGAPHKRTTATGATPASANPATTAHPVEETA